MGNKPNSGIPMPINNNKTTDFHESSYDGGPDDRKDRSLPMKKARKIFNITPMSNSLSPILAKRRESITKMANVSLAKAKTTITSKLHPNTNHRILASSPKKHFNDINSVNTTTTINNIDESMIGLNFGKEFDEEIDYSIYLDARSRLTSPGNESLSMLDEIHLELSSNDDYHSLNYHGKQVRNKTLLC